MNKPKRLASVLALLAAFILLVSVLSFQFHSRVIF